MFLVVARMVVCVLRMEEILQYERCSHPDLLGFFRHQHKMKIKKDFVIYKFQGKEGKSGEFGSSERAQP